ncbi:cryptochrome/photolyase family protein [Candidatus Finniella inopinata]|uniref:Deoxyribodipyrimidine photo-lyase n=1 Tax=Candidatus Finniella inopinata TaxID=1696036 RepID=A0A4Q7DGX0_9PROT|nr:deoxyribodipyrimidine photo-lyase [Candidatus Finniella inopinata]RZI45339.1 deoxyribodipyrimidine photo-lyase [Candidatus Finniella inopinata]
MAVLVWFRCDLRLDDHPALLQAVAMGLPIIPLYIYDPENPRPLGGASRWWLHNSLKNLDQNLQKLGGKLILKKGNAVNVLGQLVQDLPITHVFWNRRYDQTSIDQDTTMKAQLKDQGLICQSFKGSILFEPHTIKNNQGEPFKVFTPFWKHCLKHTQIEEPNPGPTTLNFYQPSAIQSEFLDDWQLLPTHPDWAGGLRHCWQPGEQGAEHRLKSFIDQGLPNYKTGRDYPGQPSTSSLSPHLRFGEISLRRIWWTLQNQRLMKPELENDVEHFLREIGWREFSYYLLYYFPDLPTVAWRENFRNFPWDQDETLLKAWQQGQTGYPIVDAGMRQLYQTGWMHNRVRMITASFLIKHLLQPWQRGEEWFWDTLVDADLASNASGWQWVAGSGADASPYFRIFNPIIQGEKFDLQGVYVRQWVPELKNLGNEFLHKPWEADQNTLKQAGIKLGQTYPFPVVNHEKARQRALQALESIKV